MRNTSENTNHTNINFEWNFPKVSFGIFAIVSAITTSSGMNETFFDGDLMTGIAIAVSIQILLIWMNNKMASIFACLPSKKPRLFLILMYIFTVFWSTGFSFVYICNHIYTSVYMRDDQEELVETYQKNMIALDNYANSEFDNTLDTLIDDISSLQTGTNTANKATETSNPTYDHTLLEQYFSKNTEMSQIISQCKNELMGDPEEMTEIVKSEKNAILKEKQTISDNITQIKNETEAINKQIRKLAKEKLDYKPGTTADMELQVLIDEEKAKKSSLQAQENSLNNELAQKETILNELNSLQSYISSKKNDANNITATNFAKILVCLGQTPPQVEQAYQLAHSIYSALSNELEKEGDHSKTSEKLQAYLTIKQQLNELADLLAIQNFCQGTNDTTNNASVNVISQTEQLVSISPTKKEKEAWMKAWNNAYIQLKSNYFLLPITKSSEIQLACGDISKLQRNTLINLNEIERSIYYITGSHPFLAWLSFFLALFLDTAPVILMAIKDTLRKRQSLPFIPEIGQ